MMTGTIVQTCVLFFIVYRTNWNKEVNFFSHLFYVYVASNEIHFTPKKKKKNRRRNTVVFNLSNRNDNLKSVKPITHAVLHICLYTSEFELKVS